MGWLFSESWPNASSLRDHLRDQLKQGGNDIKADALVAYGRRYYAAVTNKDGKTCCLVCLLEKGRDGMGWGYKDMDEFMGPYQDDCPAKVLDALSPIEDFYDDYAKGDKPDTDSGWSWARDFRLRCRARLAKAAGSRQLAKHLKPGDMVYLNRVKNADVPFKVTRVDKGRIYVGRGYEAGRVSKNRIAGYAITAPVVTGA